MFGKITKTTIFLAFCFFIFFYRGPIIDWLTNFVDGTGAAFRDQQEETSNRALAIIKCQNLCQDQVVSSNLDFSIGPCLSNQIIPDWSCDIAHSPRQAVDDNPANQCSYFRTGDTHHFVELDGNCNTIEVY